MSLDAGERRRLEGREGELWESLISQQRFHMCNRRWRVQAQGEISGPQQGSSP